MNPLTQLISGAYILYYVLATPGDQTILAVVGGLMLGDSIIGLISYLFKYDNI